MKGLAIGVLSAACVLGACGGNEAKPVARIDVNDMRARQARAIAPSEDLLAPMRDPHGPGRIIYEPPTDLTLQRRDTAVTAPFGITAAPDSAGRSPTAPAPGQRDSVRRPR
jgi:hypothetical protein